MPALRPLLVLLPIAVLLGCGGHSGYVGDPARYDADLFMVDGNGQTAAVGAAFTKVFVVQLRDSTGRVFPGHVAYFDAPTTGASGTFPGGLTSVIVVTDAEGKASSPVFTANTTAGSYQVLATSSYSGSTTLRFNLTNQ